MSRGVLVRFGSALLLLLTARSPILASLPGFPRIDLKELFSIGEWQDDIEWRPFRDGVEIHRLYGDGIEGPTAALISFRKAGTIPPHLHNGYEHILVLHGAQSDQNGRIEAGGLMINPPGTRHAVISEEGCIVLAIYEKPVTFLPE